MTFFRGYLYVNVCTVYLFLSHDCYHVPLKLRELNGSLHNVTLNGQIEPENMQLLKHALWGHHEYEVVRCNTEYEW